MFYTMSTARRRVGEEGIALCWAIRLLDGVIGSKTICLVQGHVGTGASRQAVR